MMIDWIFSLLLFTVQTSELLPRAGEYHDAKTGVNFTFPSELLPTNSFTAQAMAKSRSEAAGSPEKTKTLQCLTTPLVAVEGARTAKFGVLVFSDLDMVCREQTDNSQFIKSMVQGELEAALGKLGTPQVRTAVAYSLGKYPAALAEGTIAADASMTHSPIYGESTCLLRQQHALCWTVFGVSRQRTRQILGGEVTFAGQVPRPLIPVALLAP